MNSMFFSAMINRAIIANRFCFPCTYLHNLVSSNEYRYKKSRVQRGAMRQMCMFASGNFSKKALSVLFILSFAVRR